MRSLRAWGALVGTGQGAREHQFGEGAGAAAFQREGSLLGLLLVEGELGLQGVGVEVAFGEGGFGFGVLDGGALGFVDFEGACEVPLGLWVVFLPGVRRWRGSGAWLPPAASWGRVFRVSPTPADNTAPHAPSRHDPEPQPPEC
jgi:hypothetical protein